MALPSKTMRTVPRPSEGVFGPVVDPVIQLRNEEKSIEIQFYKKIKKESSTEILHSYRTFLFLCGTRVTVPLAQVLGTRGSSFFIV